MINGVDRMQAAIAMPKNPQRVRNADDVSDIDFTKHMNLRHRDSLGGAFSISYLNPYVTECWRIFHARLHALRIDLTHYHSEPR